MTEQLFNALKEIDTLASGTRTVYGLPPGQDRDSRRSRAGPGPGPRAVH